MKNKILVEYKWLKFKNGVGYVSIIKLAILPLDSAQKNEIIFETPDLDNHYFTAWQPAIRFGLNYALSKVSTKWKVVVLDFTGNYTSTNNAIAAFTSMLGLWNAVGYEVDQSFVEKIEDFLVTNFKSHTVPDFDKLALI